MISFFAQTPLGTSHEMNILTLSYPEQAIVIICITALGRMRCVRSQSNKLTHALCMDCATAWSREESNFVPKGASQQVKPVKPS